MLSELFRLDKIMGVCEKICYFFLVNLLFLLCNLPALLFFLFVGMSQLRTCLPLFLCSIIPLPLALCAVFFAMNRLIRGKETNAAKDFFTGYKSDLFQKGKLSAVQMLAILITWTNVEFFSRQAGSLVLTVFAAILFGFVLVLTPELYLLSSRYQMKNIDIIKNAVILTFLKPVNTLGNIAAIGLVMIGIELSPGTAVLFMASVYGFLVVFMNRKVMDELEQAK